MKNLLTFSGVFTLLLGLTQCAKSTSSDSSSAGNPTPGAVFSATVLSRVAMSLSWSAATDDVTPAAQLQYKVVTAGTTAAIDTVSEADALTGGSIVMDWTANTTTSSVSSLSAGTAYAFAVLVKDADGNKAVNTPLSATTLAYYRIYQTLVPQGGDMNGISGADTVCGSDANKPASGTYKALLSDNSTRIACTTANCGGGAGEHTGWILQASSLYARSDGTTIGTTTAAGIFSFPLTNSFASSNTVWTGIATNWTSAANNCVGWDNSVANGTEGNATATDSSSLSASAFACGNSNRILCVEQ